MIKAKRNIQEGCCFNSLNYICKGTIFSGGRLRTKAAVRKRKGAFPTQERFPVSITPLLALFFLLISAVHSGLRQRHKGCLPSPKANYFSSLSQNSLETKVCTKSGVNKYFQNEQKNKLISHPTDVAGRSINEELGQNINGLCSTTLVQVVKLGSDLLRNHIYYLTRLLPRIKKTFLWPTKFSLI